MRFTTVPSSELSTKRSRFQRLDAEFLDPELLEPERRIRALRGRSVGGITLDVSDAVLTDGEVVRYAPIDSIALSDGLIISSPILSEELPSRARWALKAGDVMVSNVRPNRGAVGLVTDRNNGAIGTSGTTVIRVDPESGFSSAFVFAYMKTRAARLQLLRRNRGSMYPAVLPADVMQVWVPAPPEALAAAVKKKVPPQ